MNGCSGTREARGIVNLSRLGCKIHLPPDTPQAWPRSDEGRRGGYRLRRAIRAEASLLYGLGSGGRRAEGGRGLLRQAWVARLALLVVSMVTGCDGGTSVVQPDGPEWDWQRALGMEFVWIPDGTFVMGSPEGEAGRDDDERQHEVRISQGFWMGKYEVTQGEWEAVMGANPSEFKACGARCPVESVSWEDVQEFIRRLNERASGSGYRYRLPTEAEWEYAARAGSAGATPEGELRILGERNAPELDGQAWYGGNGGVSYEEAFDCSGWLERQYEAEWCGTHAVGLKRANRWGLHDMLGNVCEWTGDWYGEEYPSGAVTDPRGPATGSNRVLRGGGWYSGARYVRSAYRIDNSPGARNSGLGFRLVRTE